MAEVPVLLTAPVDRYLTRRDLVRNRMLALFSPVVGKFTNGGSVTHPLAPG